MIDWNGIDWRRERSASAFAWAVIGELVEIRPNLLCDIGWSGLEMFRRSLMAAWLSRNP